MATNEPSFISVHRQRRTSFQGKQTKLTPFLIPFTGQRAPVQRLERPRSEMPALFASHVASAFPGNDVDIDVIENKNLHQKCESRQSRWLQSPLTTNINDWIDEANSYRKDAPKTRMNPRKIKTTWQTRQQASLKAMQKMSDIHRRAKLAAQKDSVSRLSRVKKPASKGYIIYSRPKSPLRHASATRRGDQNSLAKVCGLYINMLRAIYCWGEINADEELPRGFPFVHLSAICMIYI